jgi:hypothetical protein
MWITIFALGFRHSNYLQRGRERDGSLSHRRLAILVSLDGAAADDSSSMRLILKTSETFLRPG